MEFLKPVENGFTVYSKSGCKNCIKIKHFLSSQNISFTIVECDDYIIEKKEDFIFFINNLTNNKYRQFPVIFNNGIFIGEYSETINYCNKLMIDFNENF